MKTFDKTLESYEAWYAAISRHLELDALATSIDEKVIVQGTYWEGNGIEKGCHVGCTLHDFAKKYDINPSDHSAFEMLFGIPQVLARLFDCIHEGLKENETSVFLKAVRDTIRPNMDLSLVWPKLALWILIDDENPYRLNRYESIIKEINQVAEIYRQWIETNEPDKNVADVASAAAFYATVNATNAVTSDVTNAAFYAAKAAAEATNTVYAKAAASVAVYAARATAYAAYAAYADFWSLLRDKLLQLIEECNPIQNEA